MNGLDDLSSEIVALAVQYLDFPRSEVAILFRLHPDQPHPSWEAWEAWIELTRPDRVFRGVRWCDGYGRGALGALQSLARRLDHKLANRQFPPQVLLPRVLPENFGG